MDARAYTEEDTKQFLKTFNTTSPESIRTLFQQHPSLPGTIKTVINFSPDNMLALICHALLTDNLLELNKDILKKAPRWLELHMDLPKNSALTKSIEAILAAIQYSHEDSFKKTFRIPVPDTCYLNFSGADLRDLNLGSKDLSWSKLLSVNLSRAYLDNANFSHANLAHACLRESPLNNANFQSADLSFVDFTRCNLTGANFIGANLVNTNFTDTTLTNTHFFDKEVISDKKLFSDALDRMHAMLENHPQLSPLRAAIAADLNHLISAADISEQARLYNLAYQHPILKQHRELTTIRGIINNMHGWFASTLSNGRVARSPIETRGQDLFARLNNK